MAYVSVSDFELIDVASSSATPTLPEHVTDDLIMLCITQDGGGTTIATATPGWAFIGTQAASGGSRQVWAYKVATSSAEPDPTFTGANDTWIFHKFIIKDADTTTPIDVSDRTNYNLPAGGLATSGTVTTTNNNALLLYSIGSDGSVTATVNPNEMQSSLITVGTGESATVGWANKVTAGLTTAITFQLSSAGEGGNMWTIAINNKSGGSLAPFCTTTYTPIRYYGGTALTGNFAALNTIAATIAGLPTSSTLGLPANASIPEIFIVGQSFPFGTTPVTPTYQGAVDTLPSPVDLTGKLISFAFRSSTTASNTRLLPSGFFFIVADSLNNYVVYQIMPRKQYIANQTYIFVANIGTGTIFDSSGTIDYTDITQFGWFAERNSGTTVACTLVVKNLFLHDTVTLVGGDAILPAKLSTVFDYIYGDALTNFGASSFQGTGQLLIKQPLQFGDGSTPTYVNLSANSLEIPVYNETYQRPSTQKYLPVDDAVNIEIYASASDTMNFASSIFASQRQNTFTINASSSASASYDFAGMSVIGYEVTNNVAGITFNGVTFSGTRGITLNGGGMDACTVTDSINTPAVITNDPENITDTTFISAGTGHAIEITTPGTYNFTGNVFTGYGADASTDAAIYNNSGGLVTLVIPLGDATPTILNGVGASTVIDQPPVAVTATILTDSRVQLYNVTTATEIYNGFETLTSFSYTITSEATAGDTIRLRVTKKGYLPTQEQGIFSASGLAYLITQEVDEVYDAYGIDGATVTEFDADYIDTEIDLIVATNFLATRLYAWYSYILTFDEGIRYFYAAIDAIDAGNLQIDTDMVDLLFDNTTPDNVFQNDNIRIFRKDGAYPVVNPTSGGGGIDLVWRNQVYVVVSGSGVTPQDIVDIADAVWDETVAGHTTTGTTGKELSDAKSKAALAVALSA